LTAKSDEDSVRLESRWGFGEAMVPFEQRGHVRTRHAIAVDDVEPGVRDANRSVPESSRQLLYERGAEEIVVADEADGLAFRVFEKVREIAEHARPRVVRQQTHPLVDCGDGPDVLDGPVSGSVVRDNDLEASVGLITRGL